MRREGMKNRTENRRNEKERNKKNLNDHLFASYNPHESYGGPILKPPAHRGNIYMNYFSSNIWIADLGRIASQFYIKYDTVEIFNSHLRQIMNEADILATISQASEFGQLKVSLILFFFFLPSFSIRLDGNFLNFVSMFCLLSLQLCTFSILLFFI